MLIDNKKTSKIGDKLKESITADSKISIVSGLFSIYAFDALKKELSNSDLTRILLTQLEADNTTTPFKLTGDQFEIRLRNKLNQSSIAKECLNWLQKTVEARASITSGVVPQTLFHVENESDNSLAIQGSSQFTSTGLGYTESDNFDMNMCVTDTENTQGLLQWFMAFYFRVFSCLSWLIKEVDMINSNNTPLIIYQTDDGKVIIETHFENETVWLNQAQIGELFQKSKTTISEHIKNIFKDGELEEALVVRDFRTTSQHGAVKGLTQSKNVKNYNLDIVISVGYRVKSHRGVHFRKWATALIKEYLIKGFAMNDELLKEAGGGNYFDELLARIRDIRSSEKVFWRKVLDVYASSIDYDPKTEQSVMVFKTIQNKMHWASHGETASETVYARVDSSKEHIGLTNFSGDTPTKSEAEIAKSYLSNDELNILNRMVTAFLEIAEIQALGRTPMYMADWIKQLDVFLKMTNKNILQHSGMC